MRLAYLLSEYPTLGHTYLLREVRQLRATGWDIQTISIRRPKRSAESLSVPESEELKATWYVLESSPLRISAALLGAFLTSPVRFLKGWQTARRLASGQPRRILRAGAYFVEAMVAGTRLKKAGYSHVHSVYSTNVGLVLAQVFEVDLSMTLHGPDEFVNPVGFGILEKVHAASFVSSISHFGKSQIMLWSSPEDWHKVEITRLGIDTTGWVPAEFREHPDPFKLISVGRLAPVKGYPLLLQAIAMLVNEGRNIHLTLVGEGPERLQLLDLANSLGIGNRVFFAGSKQQDELRELYRDSEVCILSSFAEGIPVVFMEAMALGVPCIAPRITGIPELIRDGVEGLLVTPADVADLASAIRKMMDHPDQRRAMALAGPRMVAENYNLNKNVEHLANIFKRYLHQADASLSASNQAQSYKSSA